MNKPLLIISALITLYITGCKLDLPDFETTGTTPGTTTGTTSESYLPLTTGTTWKYISVYGTGTSDTITQRVTGATETFNGKIYHTLALTSRLQGAANGYMYNGNHILRFRQSEASQGISVTIDLQVLNDTAKVNSSWIGSVSDDGYVNGVRAQTINTVKERGISKVIGGKTFKDVINTEVALQYNFGSGFETITTYNFYVAKGIGIIATDSFVAGGGIIAKSAILEYTIK